MYHVIIAAIYGIIPMTPPKLLMGQILDLLHARLALGKLMWHRSIESLEVRRGAGSIFSISFFSPNILQIPLKT